MITAAQIKKGNTFLIDNMEDMLLQIVQLPFNKQIKPVKFTFYQCINTLVDILHDFVRSPYQVTLNIYMVDWHVKKYEKDTQIYRHFIGLTHGLKKYLDSHEDAKLFLSLFTQQRNSKEKIKWFLKLRKTILKTINAKILAEISVTHSDVITVSHILYKDPLKSRMIKKINQLFINLKRKLINTAKIDGAVACQFLLKAEQQIHQVDTPLKILNKVSSQISNKKYPIYPNHNISFSDEYPNFNPNKQNNFSIYEDSHEEDSQQIGQEFEDDQNINLESIEQEWMEKEHLFSLKNQRFMDSLKQLAEKDKDIDAKLEDSGFCKKRKFPEGWQQFLRTNKLMKEKLLSRRNY